jgi:hypothetical protein
MEAFDRDDLLQLAIDSFRWIRRADDSYRTAICNGKADFDLRMEQTVTRIYELLVELCGKVEHNLLAENNEDGPLDNLKAFRVCSEEARALLEEREWLRIARHSRVALDEQEEW